MDIIYMALARVIDTVRLIFNVGRWGASTAKKGIEISQARRIEADIYRSGLVPPGWKHAGKVDVKDGHATMYFPGKGTNQKGYRVSWDGVGEAHWTDQGLPSNHPDRHRDPRK